MPYVAPPIEQRLMERHKKLPNGCWEWTGRKHNMGYGTIGWRGKEWFLAHRASYIVFKSEIQDGLEIDHLCRNRLCINPDHLEAVTHIVNVQRGANSLKTHCPQGHEYDLVSKNGTRGCRTCNNERAKVYRAKYPERVAERMKKWNEKNPDKRREYSRKSSAKLRAESGEKLRAYQREWRAKNKERDSLKRRATRNAWAEKNREKIRVKDRELYWRRKQERDAAS